MKAEMKADRMAAVNGLKRRTEVEALCGTAVRTPESAGGGRPTTDGGAASVQS